MQKPERDIVDLYPEVDRLLDASESDIGLVMLRYLRAISDDPLRSMATSGGLVTELFSINGGYANDGKKYSAVEKLVNRAWKRLENADLIEEPDSYNGKNGFRVISSKGRAVNTEAKLAAAKGRSQFTRDLFHTLLPEASWNAFNAGDYDTAVFEAFKGVEIAVRKKGDFAETDYGSALMAKAFSQTTGTLTDKAALPGRQAARCDVFKGAFGEFRNAKAHSAPVISDALIAVEQMMVACALLRIVDRA